MSKNSNTCLFLIINYGNWSYTLKSVKSISNRIDNKVVVLDNYFDCDFRKKNKNTIDEIKQLHVEIEFMQINHGYLGAAIKYLNSIQHQIYDWVVIMNNDIIIERGELSSYLRNKTLDKNIWAIAPSIKEPNGKELNPYFKGKLSLIKKISFRLFYLNFYIAKLILWLRKSLLKSKIEISEYETYIYAMNGAVFILKNNLIKILLESSPLSFLYGEETLITELIQRNQKKILFTKELSFTHEHSITIGSNFGRQKFNWMQTAYYESLKRGYKFYK